MIRYVPIRTTEYGSAFADQSKGELKILTNKVNIATPTSSFEAHRGKTFH